MTNKISSDKSNTAYDAISRAKDSGKVRKGANEATKAIERKQALLVATAEDTSPAEIIAHIPGLCEEKGIPYISVPKKEELGKAAGLSVPTTAIAIVEAGEAKKILEDLVKGGDAPAKKAEKKEAVKEEKKAPEKKEEKKEEKPAKKEETPKAEKKEEKPEKEDKKE
jgi:large subunit ribosomal protein L7Ae|tara:strand:+ start:1231 stop:1731 length:501 start_codon:yes stop_codon:yes gene_type:complete